MSACSGVCTSMPSTHVWIETGLEKRRSGLKLDLTSEWQQPGEGTWQPLLFACFPIPIACLDCSWQAVLVICCSDMLRLLICFVGGVCPLCGSARLQPYGVSINLWIKTCRYYCTSWDFGGLFVDMFLGHCIFVWGLSVFGEGRNRSSLRCTVSNICTWVAGDVPNANIYYHDAQLRGLLYL
jgi:hypothetical protein